jgi:hypothetical protein
MVVLSSSPQCLHAQVMLELDVGALVLLWDVEAVAHCLHVLTMAMAAPLAMAAPPLGSAPRAVGGG